MNNDTMNENEQKYPYLNKFSINCIIIFMKNNT